MENCDICEFLSQPLKNQILTTAHWTAGVIPDQPYLGRTLVTLRTHKGQLSELSRQEWEEFEDIVRQLEPAFRKAFGALPLNWGCFMNHGYKDDPPHPHIHWQIFPRYKQPRQFAGLTFEDKLYGHFYDNDLVRPVDNSVVEAIVAQLKAAL